MKYSLHDLEVITIGEPETFNCSHVVGEGVLFQGENMLFLPGTSKFSHYALATLVPYIAAKQRTNDKNDWMEYESDIACPDPKCGARFRFQVVNQTEYHYG